MIILALHALINIFGARIIDTLQKLSASTGQKTLAPWVRPPLSIMY